MEHNLLWKVTFDWRQPLMEDDLPLKMRFKVSQSLVKDDPQWKMENNLWWNTTFDQTTETRNLLEQSIKQFSKSYWIFLFVKCSCSVSLLLMFNQYIRLSQYLKFLSLTKSLEILRGFQTVENHSWIPLCYSQIYQTRHHLENY